MNPLAAALLNSLALVLLWIFVFQGVLRAYRHRLSSKTFSFEGLLWGLTTAWLFLLTRSFLLTTTGDHTFRMMLIYGFIPVLLWVGPILFSEITARPRRIVAAAAILSAVAGLGGALLSFTQVPDGQFLSGGWARLLALWRAGLEAPFDGHGLGSTAVVYPRFRSPDDLSLLSQGLDSTYLRLFVEGGALLAILGFCTFMLLPMIVAFRGLSEPTHPERLRAYWAIAASDLGFAGLFSDYLLRLEGLTAFMLMLALSFRSPTLVREQPTRKLETSLLVFSFFLILMSGVSAFGAYVTSRLNAIVTATDQELLLTARLSRIGSSLSPAIADFRIARVLIAKRVAEKSGVDVKAAAEAGLLGDVGAWLKGNPCDTRAWRVAADIAESAGGEKAGLRKEALRRGLTCDPTDLDLRMQLIASLDPDQDENEIQNQIEAGKPWAPLASNLSLSTEWANVVNRN